MKHFADVGMAAKKERVAELLDCDDSDVDAVLAGIGMERSGERDFAASDLFKMK